jgi:hypothetical protein
MKRRRLGRAAAMGVRSAFIAWMAIVALIVQLGSAQIPQAMAQTGDSEAVAALGALTALLGPNVALCARGDASAPASPSHDSHSCCDDCALCQLTGHAAALVPSGHAIALLLEHNAKPLSAVRDSRIAAIKRVASAQPRAPPVLSDL